MFEDNGDRPLHLVLGDEVHLVDLVFQDVESQAARIGRREPPGKGVTGRRDHRPAFLPGSVNRWRVGGLDADEAHFRIGGLDGRAYPRDQVAAAHGQHHRIHVRQVLHDLQADGARARHEAKILAVLDVHLSGIFRNLPRPLESVGDRLTVDDQFGAEPADGIALDLRSSVGHDHRDGYAQQAAAVGNALAVVAGGRRGDPPFALCLVEQGHGIQSAPHLERAYGLEILVLDVEIQAQRLAEPGGTVHRRRSQVLVEETACPGDVSQRGMGGHGYWVSEMLVLVRRQGGQGD